MALICRPPDYERDATHSWDSISMYTSDGADDADPTQLTTPRCAEELHLEIPTPPISEPYDLVEAKSSSVVIISAVSPLTPDPSLPASPTLSANISIEMQRKLSFDPFLDLKCMYCATDKACRGGMEAGCFKSPMTVTELPRTLMELDQYIKHEILAIVDVELSYVKYKQKLKQHRPYSPSAMQHEEEAADEAIRQLSILTQRLGDLDFVAREVEALGFKLIPEELFAEVQKCRGWAEHLWGKMVKNHECLKLNFALTFTGVF